MAINLEAFVTIEQSLSKKVSTEMRKAMNKLLVSIDGALGSGDFDKAVDLVQGISLSESFEKSEKYIEYMSHVAMLFGANMVTDSPATSVVGLGFEKGLVEQSVQSLKISLVSRAEEYMKTVALQLIAQRRLAAQVVEKAGERAVLPLSSFVLDSGEAFLNVVSSLHTSRLSAYGFSAEAEALGMTQYQITEQLDVHTCPVCMEMHGKTFNVADARGFLDVVVRTQNPDELKSLQPWPSRSAETIELIQGMTTEQLVEKGWHVPPYHPGCRGLLARVGRVQPIGSPAADQYAPTEAEFEALGVYPQKKQLGNWAELIGMSPSELLSRLIGVPQVDYMTSVPPGTPKNNIKGILGIQKFLVGESVKVKLATPAFGSSATVTQEVMFSTGKASITSLVYDDVGEAVGLLKNHLKAVVSLATDMNMNYVAVPVTSGVPSFAWAKYGFAPTESGWKAIRKTLLEAMPSVKMTPLQQKGLTAILSLDDPKSIFAVADIPEVGKALLSDVSWAGQLDLKSEEAMTRFMAYIGAGK